MHLAKEAFEQDFDHLSELSTKIRMIGLDKTPPLKTISEIRRDLASKVDSKGDQMAEKLSAYFAKTSPNIKVSMTLQTRLVVKRNKSLAEQQWINLQEDFHRFSSRLNYRFFGNGNRRKPHQFSLLVMPVIEGRLFSPEGHRTLHYHVGLGNLPEDQSLIGLRNIIHQEWAKTSFGMMDIEILPANTGWLHYITKEAGIGNIECVDWRNMFVPRAALGFLN